MKRVAADASQQVISDERSLQEKRTRTQLVVLPQTQVATLEIPDGSPVLESVQSLVTQDAEGNQQIFQIQNASTTTTAATIIDQQDLKTEACEDGNSATGVVIAQHMDITEPLTTLRTLLEHRLQMSLTEYSFYLQDAQELDSSKNLVNQCVQGEGLVQINIELIEKGGVKKINIVDVLKPAEEVPESTETIICDQNLIGEPPVVRKVVIPVTEETEHVTRWIVSPEFKVEQEKMKIPADPANWKHNHVKHWIQWAIGHFNLQGILSESWNIDGKHLMDLTHAEFMKKVPFDPSDLFWTHLELLRKCQIVAIVQQPTYVQQFPQVFTTVTKSFSVKNKIKTQRVGTPRVAYEGCPGNRTGNNGQIQLWQFLLEMLTDKDSREYIQWIGVDGEFKLNNPEMVAQLWGQRKNKPTMNYEKLSRALRYYYDGDMIAKVHGKRFVYKFVCDLKSLLGYSAAELNRLVTDCELKKSDNLGSPVLQRPLREIRPAPSAEAGL